MEQKMLASVRLENVKRWLAADIKISRGTILHGRNGSGKTAIIQAIQLGVLGYVPGYPARVPVAELAAPGKTVAAELLDASGWGVRREFAIDEAGRSKQKMRLGAKPAATLEDGESAIDAHWGRLAVALDLAEFLASSPDKQAAAIFALSRAGVSGWDPAAFLRAAALEALRSQVGAEAADLVARVSGDAPLRGSLERATGAAFAGALAALEADLARLARDSSDMQGGVLATQERARGLAKEARKARAESVHALRGLETEALGLAVAPEGLDLAREAAEARNRLATLREALARAEGVGQERKRLEIDLSGERKRAAPVAAEDFAALKDSYALALRAVADCELSIRLAREAREASIRARKFYGDSVAARAEAIQAHEEASARNQAGIEQARRAREALGAAETESRDAARDLQLADRKMRAAMAAREAGEVATSRAKAAADAGASCPLCRQAIPEAHRAEMAAEAIRLAAILRGLEGEAAGAIAGVKSAEGALHSAELATRAAMQARNAAELELAASGEALKHASIPADPGPEPALATEALPGVPAELLMREIYMRDALAAAEAADVAARRVGEIEARLRALPPAEAPGAIELQAAESALTLADAAARGAAEADGLRAGIERRKKAAEDAVARADAAIAFGAGIAHERDRILSETLGPVREAIQSAMPTSLLRGRRVYVGLVAGKAGRPELDMGLESEGVRATLRVLSDGEACSFYSGLSCAIMARSEVPLRILLLNNAAELDEDSFAGVVGTINSFLADGRLSNAILTTCHAPEELPLPAGWAVVGVEALHA